MERIQDRVNEYLTRDYEQHEFTSLAILRIAIVGAQYLLLGDDSDRFDGAPPFMLSDTEKEEVAHGLGYAFETYDLWKGASANAIADLHRKETAELRAEINHTRERLELAELKAGGAALENAGLRQRLQELENAKVIPVERPAPGKRSRKSAEAQR